MAVFLRKLSIFRLGRHPVIAHHIASFLTPSREKEIASRWLCLLAAVVGASHNGVDNALNGLLLARGLCLGRCARTLEIIRCIVQPNPRLWPRIYIWGQVVHGVILAVL